MFNAETLSDRVAAMSLEKRRNRETQRRERIFHAKARTIGLDKDALDMQVQEKKKQEETEKERRNAYAADTLLSSKAAQLLNSRQMKERQAMEKAVAQYRHHHQQPWNQREYDLNDPEHCRNADGEGSQMMLPGMPGEDPDSKTRVKRQKQQLRYWLIQQQNERAAARLQQRQDELCYQQIRADMNSKALQLQNIEMERRRAMAIATKDYNLAKCAKTEENRRQEQLLNDADNRTDIMNHLQGLPAGEEAEPTLGVLGVPCLWPFSDKRAPPVSPQQLTQFQMFQTEEKKRIEFEKRCEEEQHERVRLDSARAALLLERQQARVNRQLRRDLDYDNVKLAKTHKQQNQALERGAIDDSFFSKFNTDSR